MIKLQQDALTDINKNQDTAIRRRNFLYVPPNLSRGSRLNFPNNICVACSGIQLLEQDEVVWNYKNKVSVQDAAIAERNVELETAEKEARDLRLAVREEKRQIGLRKKELLEEKCLEGEIATLQIEVGEHRHTQMFVDVQIKFGVYLHIIVALINIKISFGSKKTNGIKKHKHLDENRHRKKLRGNENTHAVQFFCQWLARLGVY